MIEDSKIREALFHWQPRFLANGVDYNDLQRIIGSMSGWDDWCRTWSAVGAEHAEYAEKALADGRLVTAGQAFQRAAVYYHFGQMIFYTDKAQKFAAHSRQVALYQKAAPLLHPPAERLEIPFGETSMPGYLRLPKGIGPHSCVILVCGTDSVKEQESPWENALLARGMATLSFDGPGQGEMWARMKMRVDFEKAIVAVVDYLHSRSEIDAARIGILGHSMGGYLAARGAAHEPRLAAVVVLAGYFRRGDWEEMRLFSRAGLQHLFDLKNEAEVREVARQLTLEGIAGNISSPLLIVHGEKDTIIPVEAAHKLAEATTCPTELLIFPEGNHSCNNIVYKVRPAVTDWLAEQLEKTAHSEL
jgi:dipeptidyl aminopeptidase/acylaminoacyl peptidase